MHEIHLRSKQLVFLFMTATAAAVVIFLCGVLVGRGVASPGRVVIDAAQEPVSLVPLGEPEPPLQAPRSVVERDPVVLPAPVESARSQDPGVAVPTEAADDPVPASTRAAVAEAPDAVPAEAAAPPVGEPSGDGFVVQVAAVSVREEADSIASRLRAKGYESFVTTPGSGVARVFRVRVGRYRDRREAEAAATRLEREERFDPWITR